MTGLVRKATLFVVCGLLAAGAAMANVPDPTQSDCGAPDGWIYVVGNNGIVGDPVGTFCVTVIGLNGLPIENSNVEVDFRDCDVDLCPDQLDADVKNDPCSGVVGKFTDASGVACFTILGKSKDGLGCSSAPVGCVKIFADGVLLCQLNAPTFDLVNDGDGSGVGAGDLSAWVDAFLCGTSPTRADYICDGVVGADDLAKWLDVFLAGGSAVGCQPKCP